MRERSGYLFLALALVFVACGEDQTTPATRDAAVDMVSATDMGADQAPRAALEIEDGCNPVGAPVDCLLPFPSDVFLKDGALRVPENALPQAQLATGPQAVDFQRLHPTDGASPYPPILARFEVAIDPASVTFHTDDISATTSPSSATILLDSVTGELVPHFAEVDPRPAQPERRALIIRPMEPLEWSRRYVVALQGVRDITGSVIPANEGFRRLRDDDEGPAALEAIRSRYDADVFEPLTEAGVSRAGLQLAWDFTVRSEDDAIGDMKRVREHVMTALDAAPPVVSNLEVQDDVNEWIGRRIRGTLTLPLYMKTAEPGALLNRDENGEVVPNGTADVPFIVVIPRAVMSGETDGPARAIQFGHGFFGGKEEISSGPVKEFANAHNSVIFGVDWWGMSAADRGVVLQDIVDDPSSTVRFTERVHQGMANQIALSYAMQSTLTELAELKLNDALIYDPSAIYFWGISQGHILGGTYMALAPRVDRAVLEVGGAALTFIMFRAGPFVPFLAFIQQSLDDELDHQKFAALAQTSFDHVDPVSYARLVRESPLPNGPQTRSILMAAGLGDPAVPNLATFMHARALGLPVMTPSPLRPYGFEEVEGPADSALVIYDFGLDEPLPGTFASGKVERNDVHDSVRTLAPHQARIDAFLQDGGQIPLACDGVCDPE